MKMHTVDTTGRDTPRDSDAPNTSDTGWTVRSAIESTSSAGRAISGVAALGALALTLHPDVPLVSGMTVAALVPAAMVDALDRRLPNRMVFAAALLGVVVASTTVLLGGHLDAAGAALGVAACAGPLLAMHLISPASMGFGDVKAAVVIGAAVGLIDPVFGLVVLTVASLGAAITGLARRVRTVAYGPALVGGAVLTLGLVASPIAVLGTDRNARHAQPAAHTAHTAHAEHADQARHAHLGAASSPLQSNEDIRS